MPPKDFDYWNQQKKKLHEKELRIYFKDREIWWCVVGTNVGYEQDGKNESLERPVFILKKLGKRTFIGIPLTTTCRSNRYQMQVPRIYKKTYLMLEQIRMFDSRRLLRKYHRLTKDETITIIAELTAMFLESDETEELPCGSSRGLI